jgi:uncharacterized NAD-dependent epimerase/dehydratase family protein
MSEEDALAAISSASEALGLPVCDPVRQRADRLWEAIRKYKEQL